MIELALGLNPSSVLETDRDVRKLRKELLIKKLRDELSKHEEEHGKG